MNRFCILVLLILLFSSCATLFNKKSYEVILTTNHPETQIQLEDKTYYLPYYLNVERSQEDLSLKLINDTISKDFIIKPSLSPRFLYGNLVWLYACPVAYAVDLYSTKRFYYGKSIFLDLNDTTTIIKHKATKVYSDYFSKPNVANTGQVNLILSLPWINNFYLYPENESLKTKTGIIGFSIGLDYYYKKGRFVNFSAYSVMNLWPIAENLDYYDEESMHSFSFNITNNLEKGRFTLGYGLNYSINSWKYEYYEQPESLTPIYNSVTKTKQSIGFTLSGYHRIWKKVFIGISYRPTIINISPEIDFKYEHVISLDLALKIRIKK